MQYIKNKLFKFSIAVVCILFLLCTSLSVSSQNFNYSASLETVSYSSAHMISMLYDGTDDTIPTSNQWNADGNVYPMAIRSGSQLSASATIQFNCLHIPEYIFIKGNADDAIIFPPKKCMLVSGTTGLYMYPKTLGAGIIQDTTVRFLEDYTSTWEVSIDSANWTSAGNASNLLMVTLNTPITIGTGYYYDHELYYSLFYIGCKNADGANTNEEMIAAIWEDFTDLVVLKPDGDPLLYYGPVGLCTDLGTFLTTGNGYCTIFANFFLSLLKVQGFTEANNSITFWVSQTTDCGTMNMFLVKNWNFNTPQNLCDDLPYISTPFYYYDADDATDLLGVAGQSNANPPGWFGSHSIIEVNGVIYDPSYGVTYSNIDALEDEVMDGFGYYQYNSESALGYDVDGDGVIEAGTYYTFMQLTNDMDKANVTYYYYTY